MKNIIRSSLVAVLIAFFTFSIAAVAGAEPSAERTETYYGFVLGKDGAKAWMVYVQPDSAAYAAGLREGLEVIAIGGEPIAAMKPEQIQQVFKGAEGEIMEFRTRQSRGDKDIRFKLDAVTPSNIEDAFAKLDALEANAAYGLSKKEKGALFVLGAAALIGWAIVDSDISRACRTPCDRCDEEKRIADCAECRRCIDNRTK